MENPARHPYFVALFEAAKALHSSLELQEVLQEIARNSAQAVGARAASLRLADSQGRMALVASHGLSDVYLTKGTVTREKSDIDRLALQGETVVVLDAPNDARFQYRNAAREEGLRSVLSVPVMLDDRGIGVLRVYTEEVRRFDGGEIELLTAMATLGAIAIRNAEEYTRMRESFHSLESFVTNQW
jgi:signal transduction protein with GAF and PtsI domain